MKRLIVFILLCVPFFVQGQSTNISTLFQSNFKKAEALYNQFAYRNALQLYLHVAEKDTGNYVARQRIADCYFRLGNNKEAERWYAHLAKLPGIDPKYKYQYAQILSIQGKYGDAEKWFGEYRSASGDPRAKAKLEFIYYLSYYMRDSVLYSIQQQPFNSDQSDFAPQFYRKGIVFISARDRDLFLKRQSLAALNDKEVMLNVFYAPFSSVAEEDAQLFYHQDLNSPYHDGPVTFFQDGKRIAFSRNNLKAGKPVHHSGRVNLKLYFASLNDRNEVSGVEEFPFNNDQYSISHPWVSNDGTELYFSSDMPGGQGGADIYHSSLNEKKWSEPKNLGSTVNTMGDEFYPYLANDSTLYFSSNGHGGLGGLDIYLSYRHGQRYSVPKNMGFPLNTSSDDLSLIVDESGRKGLFSSNRPGGSGYDDIYSFSVNSFFLDGKVIDRKDSAENIADARVVIMDEKEMAIDSTVTDSNGNFHFDLAFDKDYLLKPSKEGYTWIDSLKKFSTYSRAMGHDTLELALWKQALFAKGLIYSNESQDKLAKVVVTLENLTDGTIDSVITNTTGAYDFKVEPNKKYHITATKPGFLGKDFHLNTTGLLSGNLLNDILLEEEFIDKVIIQFEFDKALILNEEKPKFDEALKFLHRRPKATLKVSAFADSHGTKEYNQSLSDRRAAAVVRHFEAMGIDPKRIEATGFGEALLLNNCSDGVECSSEEHAKNRRAELKVQN
jgi:outer membrane protein OmpA-like peptidoglycan-associated protein/tetratricopeptide (TPR) repeat protein